MCKKATEGAKKRGVFKQSKVDTPSGRFGGDEEGPFKLYGDAFQGGLGSDDNQKVKLFGDENVVLDKATKTEDGRYPCPTCGRCFNEDAAGRHFSMCKRLAKKNAGRMKFL